MKVNKAEAQLLEEFGFTPDPKYPSEYTIEFPYGKSATLRKMGANEWRVYYWVVRVRSSLDTYPGEDSKWGTLAKCIRVALEQRVFFGHAALLHPLPPKEEE